MSLQGKLMKAIARLASPSITESTSDELKRLMKNEITNEDQLLMLLNFLTDFGPNAGINKVKAQI